MLQSKRDCLHSIFDYPNPWTSVASVLNAYWVSAALRFSLGFTRLVMVFKMCFPKSGGNNLAKSSEEDRRKNEEIDKMIRKDRKLQARQVKILLLGKFSGF